ncbi:checkpoint protein HUS1-like isoform X2 [Anthonomus grandis grandis]|uniref:checkpoint protein HUS1-like isoform X2 n=1 Tax=Anthonomus grandis grandis TaxID=2921223 RepID=UPI002165E732|nr:checkpoint protein HUS1-like isoform X2 [Anthonomus grandis grandis]XP_050296999.1 checkpoint protein HUS1-like isoform X2 [Anthonomus grandis grandis]
MKFRALIIEAASMRDFLNISLSLSKFSKTCVLRLTTKKIYFIVSEDDGGPRRPLVWCELPVSFYFKEYNIVGVSELYNEIFLELSTALLARSCSVLKQDVKTFKIKLTNKDSPCLTLEMELVSGEQQGRQCVHDIPVEVISRKHWSDYQEPGYDDFHVSIQMPNLRSLKNIVEKMKNMSHSLIVKANKAGKLTLQIKTSTVKLSAHFPGLNVNSFAGHVRESVYEDEDDNSAVSSTIDIKKFITFLTGMQLNHCQAVCNIVQGKMVKLYMEQPGALALQIFLTELNV